VFRIPEKSGGSAVFARQLRLEKQIVASWHAVSIWNIPAQS